MNISVIGAGYVGLTTAACLAELGHPIFCAESDVHKLAMLRAGKLPFFEPHFRIDIVAAQSNRANVSSSARRKRRLTGAMLFSFASELRLSKMARRTFPPSRL